MAWKSLVGLCTLSLALTGLAVPASESAAPPSSLTAARSIPRPSTSSSTQTLVGPVVAASATSSGGLLLASNSGSVVGDGNATASGDTYTDGLTGLGGSKPLNAPIVGMATVPNNGGYYLVGADGGVFNFGGAPNHGSTYSYGITGLGGSKPLAAPIVGMATTPHGHGYWLVAADGGVFNFGSAKFYGSTYSYGITGLGGSKPLNAPIVAIVPTPNGGGYWLVAKDGGVFDFGDAHFYGSTYSYGITGLGGSKPLGGPIVGAAATPDGGGYYLVGADGGVFDFGDAHFDGSTYSKGYTGLGGSNPLPSPVAAIAPDPDGNGYWAVTQTGTVFSFGGAASIGVAPTTPASPIGGAPNEPNTSSPLANPSQDYPQPYLEPCTQDNMNAGAPNTIGCQDAALTTYNQENASEGLPSVQLPTNFNSLPRDEQIFILVNEARVDRGLAPVYGLAAGLQGEAAQAAETDYDPDPENVLPPGQTVVIPRFGRDPSAPSPVCRCGCMTMGTALILNSTRTKSANPKAPVVAGITVTQFLVPTRLIRGIPS